MFIVIVVDINVVFVVVMTVVVCCLLVVFCSLFCFYVVMLLSKLEAGEQKTEIGGGEVEQLPVKIKGGIYVRNS